MQSRSTWVYQLVAGVAVPSAMLWLKHLVEVGLLLLLLLLQVCQC
jgi:hypothetical protein